MRSSKNLNKDQQMLASSVPTLFLRFLFPSVIATMFVAGNFLIDTICVGLKIGEAGLAALNVVVPVTGLLYAIGFLFGYGSSNLFSNRMGEGKRAEARRYYVTSVAVMGAVTVLIMVVGVSFNDQISYLLCAGASFHTMSAEYLRYVFWFAPCYCFETFYTVYMRNDGSPGFSMVITTVTTSSNIILDILLVWELQMGMAGAALATGLALALGFLVAVCGTLRKNSDLKVWQSSVNPVLIGEMVYNGAPDFLREFSGSVVVLLVNLILMWVSGDTAVSAYGVIANLGNVVVCGLAGVSNAVQPLVSYNIGAGCRDRAAQLLRLGRIASLVLALAYVVFAELCPEVLVSAFLDHPTPALSGLCRVGIRIISPAYVLAGQAVLLNVYFEAVHAPRQAFWTAMIRGMAAPVICIVIFVLLWDVNGVWIAFIVSEAVGLLAAALMYRGVKRNMDKGGAAPALCK